MPASDRLSLPKLPAKVLAPLAFVMAAVSAGLVAWAGAVLVEGISTRAVRSKLANEGVTFAAVAADGLQIHLTGTAPNEATRYRIVNMVGTVVDSARIRDMMEVIPVKAFEAPKFSVEMLRNDDGIQLIGLLPEAEAVASLTEAAQALTPNIPLADMLETAAYPAPPSWAGALKYGTEALQLLPRSKISVSSEAVVITAIASSDAEKRSLERQLNGAKPDGLAVTIEISAPRPVLTPFTLRFVKDAEGARFDSCSADTDAARARILAAAVEAGVTGTVSCTVGLGVPTPRWSDAIRTGILAVSQLDSATLTFADADVTLLVGSDVSQADFDRVVGELENALPDVFSISSALEKKEAGAPQGPAEFTAVLAEGSQRIDLRGRLSDAVLRDAVESFAMAEFGSDKVLLATRIDAELPDGWPVRVLAGLQALAELDHGKLLVRDDLVEVSGVTGSQSAKVRISQILSGKLGQGETFRVNVTYDEALDPLAALPTPQECLADVQAVAARQKITFTPGSAEIDANANAVMLALAAVLQTCPGVKIEVAGYTDAQGSEEGNRALSQARAESVVLGLQGRRVDVSGMEAKGYGEADPVGENETEAGREANRRIEFRLIGNPLADLPPDQARAAELAASGLPVVPKVALPAAESAEAGPDFSGDTSPSVAPTEKTIRPKARPKNDG